MPFIDPTGQHVGWSTVPQPALGMTQFVDDVPINVDNLKAQKSAEITAACLAAIDAGFEYGGHQYDSDLVSRTNIIGTATGVQAGIPMPDGFTWRTSDNQNVPMDGAGVISLGAALLQHVNEQYATSWQLKAQIEAATTPEEVEAVSWPPPDTEQPGT